MRLNGTARLIPALTKDMRIKRILIGTVSRTGIAGSFIGNTAEGVLQQVDCADMTVKSAGFPEGGVPRL